MLRAGYAGIKYFQRVLNNDLRRYDDYEGSYSIMTHSLKE